MKKSIFIFFALLLSACTSIEDRPSIPDTVLPVEEMAKVLVDVHLLEAALNISTYSRDQVVMNNINPNSDILKKNNVTKKQYDESFEFYSRNPLLLTEVYQLVLNDLSKMQAEVMTQK
ncbi:hypothetical protein BH10BAC1_BH10BAC1_21170 [soil metagenome]